MKKQVTHFMQLSVLLVLVVANNVAAYEDKTTHPALTKRAVENTQLDQYLKNQIGLLDGLSTTFPLYNSTMNIRDLLQQGSTAEDVDPCRRSTHFLNPLREWIYAGIDEWPASWCFGYKQPYSSNQYSALTWGTGYETYNGQIVDRNNQSMGWDKAKSYFYSALTSTTSANRDAYFAKTFQSVGQVLHLLQDMAVPAHTRNDFVTSHLIQKGANNPYELYVLKPKIKNLIATLQYVIKPQFTNPTITDFWDTSDSSVLVPGPIVNPAMQTKAGLAEYTNANFLSEGTLFSNPGAFTYPSQTSTEIISMPIEDPLNPGTTKIRPYYYKTQDWEKNYLLAGVDLITFSNLESTPSFMTILPLDDSVHEHYAKLLLPRAVGYSAALLDYFFRGNIEITLPDNGVYAITEPNGSFTTIRIKAQNKTTDETMTNGAIQLIVKYKIAQADPFQSIPVATSPDFFYIIAPERNNTASISGDTPTGLVFDLPDPLPLWATDVYIQVVYKGQLGNEPDAVAVGFKDISEPTPIDIINNIDYTCINGNYMLSGSPESVAAVDIDHNGSADHDVYPDSLIDDYLAFSPALNGQYASSTNYNALFPEILPGSYGRVFILTDYEARISNKVGVKNLDTRDSWTTYYSPFLAAFTGIKNQTESVTEIVYENGLPATKTYQAKYYPGLINERGVNVWWFVPYENDSYPSGTSCTTETRTNLAGPAGAAIVY